MENFSAVSEQLKQLKELFEAGLLTEAEYGAKKQELLSGVSAVAERPVTMKTSDGQVVQRFGHSSNMVGIQILITVIGTILMPILGSLFNSLLDDASGIFAVLFLIAVYNIVTGIMSAYTYSQQQLNIYGEKIVATGRSASFSYTPKQITLAYGEILSVKPSGNDCVTIVSTHDKYNVFVANAQEAVRQIESFRNNQV